MSEVIRPQKGKQELAMKTKADVLIYGGAAGSGKSRLLLMKPLEHMDDPNFTGVFFRKTVKNLEGAGGLWPEGWKLYQQFGVHKRDQAKEYIFPSGMKVAMTYLARDEDAEENHQGLQYSFVGFDELTHFSQFQFLYLIGRLRSDSDADSFCMASCNPDPDSWVLNWVDWYLNEDGDPLEERCGQIRYFVIKDEMPRFADTAEELAEQYPEICYVEDNDGEQIYVPPMTFCFINGTIFDNPALIKANPSYLSKLKGQSEVNRRRLLDGNWYARPEGANYFKRDWLPEIKESDIPRGCTEVRGWDKAGTEPNDNNRNPDYTAGSPKFHKCREGFYYLTWDFIESLHDEYKDTEVTGRFRKIHGPRDRLILNQAKHDGKDCRVVLPKDPAQAGKVEYKYSAVQLTDAGFLVHEDPTPTNKSKLVRAQPFFNACENGLVSIVKESFPNEKTYNDFMNELEKFDGEPSNAHKKDDWVDGTASAFNYLQGVKVHKIVERNQNTVRTAIADMLDKQK